MSVALVVRFAIHPGVHILALIRSLPQVVNSKLKTNRV